ncbi:hypothetical protein C8J56DRAFT_1048729 [Mycena floridula]|nr:hypothetical protein C8J56DRAFT_1048729 [Mycena floridula]
MPLDILFEIFSYLEPIDLVRLLRVNKIFRDTLIAPNSLYIWKDARRRHGGADIPKICMGQFFIRPLRVSVERQEFETPICYCEASLQVMFQSTVTPFANHGKGRCLDPETGTIYADISRTISRFYWIPELNEVVERIRVLEEAVEDDEVDAEKNLERYKAQRLQFVAQLDKDAPVLKECLSTSTGANAVFRISDRFLALGYEQKEKLLKEVEQQQSFASYTSSATSQSVLDLATIVFSCSNIYWNPCGLMGRSPSSPMWLPSGSPIPIDQHQILAHQITGCFSSSEFDWSRPGNRYSFLDQLDAQYLCAECIESDQARPPIYLQLRKREWLSRIQLETSCKKFAIALYSSAVLTTASFDMYHVLVEPHKVSPSYCQTENDSFLAGYNEEDLEAMCAHCLDLITTTSPRPLLSLILKQRKCPHFKPRPIPETWSSHGLDDPVDGQDFFSVPEKVADPRCRLKLS